MNAKEYITKLLSLESYSFSLEEISLATNTTPGSLKSELVRLIDKQEIISLRKGFYLIIPPRYSKTGHLPIQLYIDKLFKSLNRNYYLGFYTAANFHGAAHQQPQKDYVMIANPMLKDIAKKTYNIQFICASNWPEGNVELKKSDAGYFAVSSPALTAADLIHHHNKLGGINRILPVIEELTEAITLADLEQLLKWYPNTSTLQRMGLLIEELVGAPILTDAIKQHIDKRNYYPVLMSPMKNRKPGAVNNTWKVDVNVELESDL